jgi:hypothetical protein
MFVASHFNLNRVYRLILTCALTLAVHQPYVVRSDQTTALGKTWTIRQAPLGLREVTYGAGKFVALGGGKLATSPDGVTWTEQTPPAGSSWTSSIFAQGKFVALSGTDSEQFPTNVMTSSDGLNWNLSRDGLTPGSLWLSLAYGNGTFVAGSFGTLSSTYMATSPDAVTWTPVALPVGSPGIVKLAFGNGAFVAVQSSNGVQDVRSLLRSTNGVDWQEQALPSSASPELVAVAFGRGQFIAVGGKGTIISSPDGITWTNRAEPGAYTLVEILDAGESYIAFGFEDSSSKSIIITSPDGITWTRRRSPSSLSRISAAYAHGVVVAVSALDNPTETIITSGAFKMVTKVAFRKGNARLSDEAKSALTTNLSELDTTRKVQLSVQTQSTQARRATLLARKRVLEVVKYIRLQRPSQLSVRMVVKSTNRVQPSARDLVTTTFTYR